MHIEIDTRHTCRLTSVDKPGSDEINAKKKELGNTKSRPRDYNDIR